MSNYDEQPRNPRPIIWDEEQIAAHDKLKYTRQKITEPNTPYEHMDRDEMLNEMAAQAEILANYEAEKLTKLQEEYNRKRDFEAKRRQHYNVAVMLQQPKKQEEDEDEDEI